MYTRVESRFWQDEKMREVTCDARYLMLYFLTSPHRNILGLYFLPAPYACFDLGWDEQRFMEGLGELLSKGCIKYDKNNHIIFIVNFLRHNPLDNPNQVKSAIDRLDSLPQTPLVKDLCEVLEHEKSHYKPLIEQLHKRFSKQLDNPSETVNETLSKQEEVKEEEEETEEVKEEEILSSGKADDGRTPIPYDKIINLYNQTCISLPKVQVVNEKRKKAMRARWKEYPDVDFFESIFIKAESSNFLSGRNGKWGSCNFDWIMNPNNMIKILEGTYDNKNSQHSRGDPAEPKSWGTLRKLYKKYEQEEAGEFEKNRNGPVASGN